MSAKTSDTDRVQILLETLHTLGVRLGVLDPNVAADGPQILTAMGAYSDHLTEVPRPDDPDVVALTNRIGVLEIQNSRIREQRDEARTLYANLASRCDDIGLKVGTW